MDRERAAEQAELLRADAEIDRLSQPMAGIVTAAINKFAARRAYGAVITPYARRRIMREVDKELRRVYGVRRGDSSPMYDAIAQSVTAMAGGAILRETAALRRLLRNEPALLASLVDPPEERIDL